MIFESYYWKNELYKNYKCIVNFITLKKKREESFAIIEKAIMLSVYIIRKINDAEKIPPHFLKEKISVKYYQAAGKNIDHMNWHRIDENYILEHGNYETQDWKFVLNHIIHSFTFLFDFDNNNTFCGIFFNSDYSKDKKLFYISIRDMIKIILKISEGSIVEAHCKREEIIQNGQKILAEMHLIDAKYAYPDGFDLDKVVENSMDGIIYRRDANIK